MVARPGRLQAAFNSGELTELLWERTEIKYFSTGAAFMENVRPLPQGGFTLRDGLRDIGAVAADAARIMAFDASDGSSYDLVFSPVLCQPWGESAAAGSFAVGVTAPMLSTFSTAQQLDTMILFHPDLKPQRIKLTDAGFSTDDAPFVEIPNYNYGKKLNGDPYDNAVAAVWQIQFVGLAAGTSVFTLTVAKQDTLSIEYVSDTTALADAIKAAIEDLPNVATGIEVAFVSGAKFNVTFSGAGNEGDNWAISGTVINKADAAILAFKSTPGVAPGEPIFSDDRGYPACGTFYTQRLLMGGLKSRPNIWLFSKEGDYYNFDERFTEANGPAVIPMDVTGGEKIVAMTQNRYLLIFTTQAEYWISDRALSRTSAPNHVQASRNGSAAGVPPVENEGAALYIHKNRSVLGEFRYTDVEGNFVSADISLLGAHLMHDVVDQAIQHARTSTSGNILSFIRSSDGDDGTAGLVTILREQDVTAFSRVGSAGTFKAVNVNGRNETSFLVDRADGRRLERFEEGLLLDAATTLTLSPATKSLTGLSRYEGEEVWVIGDRNVYGPYTVTGEKVTLPVAVSSATVGYWKPPVVSTLPLPRTIGPHIVLKRPARIHSVDISLIDTSSLAIAINGGKVREVDLARYGSAKADVGELDQLFTGTVKIRGLTGWADDPQITITQLRPGPLTVRSITLEASL